MIIEQKTIYNITKGFGLIQRILNFDISLTIQQKKKTLIKWNLSKPNPE
jgi:hypothetical protein